MNKQNVTNEEFAKQDKNFLAACERAGIEPTKRQASKFRQLRGVAYKAHREIVKETHDA